MDSLELNKILGALLGACLFVMSIGIVSGAVFAPHKPKTPGYDLPGAEATPASTGGAAAAPSVPLVDLLAKADPKKGEASAKACTACHAFEKGGPNKVGPGLYGVVGGPVAQHPGYSYSDALKGKGGEWSFDKLAEFIKNPKAYAPGTKMAYAGEKDDAKRADILAYLRSLSDNPAPLPTK